MLLSTLGILLLLVGGGLVFVNTSSQFGQNPKGADVEDDSDHNLVPCYCFALGEAGQEYA